MSDNEPFRFLKIRRDAAKLETQILKIIALDGIATQSELTIKIKGDLEKWPVIHTRVNSLEKRGLVKEVCRKASTHGKEGIYYGLNDEALALLVAEPDMQENITKMLDIAYDSDKGFNLSVTKDELGRLAAEKWLENNEELHKTLEESFTSTFNVAYNLLHQHGLESGYRRLLQIIEYSAMNILNKDIEDKLLDIRNDKFIGDFLDPHFTIHDITLNSIYQDALLTKRIGHFLTANHRYVLIKSKEFIEEELIEHNREWVRRFEEEEIEGENKPNAQLWRLFPNRFVDREMEIREKRLLSEELQDYPNQTYGMKFQEHYNKLRVQKYSRNGFQIDEKWPIDINKTRKNYETRKKAREIEMLGIDIETIIKTQPSENIKQYKKLIDEDTTFDYQ